MSLSSRGMMWPRYVERRWQFVNKQNGSNGLKLCHSYNHFTVIGIAASFNVWLIEILQVHTRYSALPFCLGICNRRPSVSCVSFVYAVCFSLCRHVVCATVYCGLNRADHYPYLRGPLHLQWRHMSFMASQIIGNSTFCSIAC